MTTNFDEIQDEETFVKAWVEEYLGSLSETERKRQLEDPKEVKDNIRHGKAAWKMWGRKNARSVKASMTIGWRSWGISPHEEMKHRLEPWECPYCNHQHQRYWEHCVGFSDEKEEYKHSSWANFSMAGVVVIECPSCFELSWCHITEESCDDNWLQMLSIPTAKEAYRQMLERVKGGDDNGKE